MKIKKDYVLQKIADEYIVVPIGEEADRLHGVIRLNDAGAYLWEILEKGVTVKEELQMALMQKYGIERTVACDDVDAYLSKISAIDCIEL